MKPRWRDVPEFPGYQVSDHGEIRSFWNRGARPPRIDTKSHLVKLLPNPRGYLYAKLCYQGRRKTFLVHRLMLSVFIGPAPEKAMGLHKDDDRLNNHLENLYWGDWHANSKDKARNGNSNKGCRNGQCRLTEEQVREIYARRKQGDRLIDVAADFDITPSNVSAIGCGRSWQWLTNKLPHVYANSEVL